MKRTLFLVLLFVAGITTSLSAAEFIAKIIDGLGYPVPGVDATVSQYVEVSEDSFLTIDSLGLISDSAGFIKGGFNDEKPIGSDVSFWIELHKEGYEVSTSEQLKKEYVIRQFINGDDLERVANLSGDPQINELRALLSCKYKVQGADFEELVFFHENRLRPDLRLLFQNEEIDTHLLSLIGVPEDIRFMIRNGPPPKRGMSEHRLAYSMACALFEPTYEEEWNFLKACASGDYNSSDLWVAAGAISTLQLISSPRSLEILEEARKTNFSLKKRIDKAIGYIESNPPKIADSSLVEAGNRLARVIQIGNWEGNKMPYYNKEGDKALIDCEFWDVFESVESDSEYIDRGDGLIYTATFHKVDGVWKLRGVRETIQALIARVKPKMK